MHTSYSHIHYTKQKFDTSIIMGTLYVRTHIYVTVSAKTLHVRVQILAYFLRFEIS